jgi:hypothetical protein
MGKSAAALALEPRIGQRFDAIVTGASHKGTWVRLLHPPVEGKLVHGFEGLDVGDRVRVVLISTNVERGFIDFALSGRGDALLRPPEGAPRGLGRKLIVRSVPPSRNVPLVVAVRAHGPARDLRDGRLDGPGVCVAVKGSGELDRESCPSGSARGRWWHGTRGLVRHRRPKEAGTARPGLPHGTSALLYPNPRPPSRSRVMRK